MQAWSIQQQEFAIQRSLFWSGFISLVSISIFIRQLALHWAESPDLAMWLEAPSILLYFYSIYRICRQPELIRWNTERKFNADWRADFNDEYLKQAFLQASNKGYQSAVGIAVVGSVLTLSPSDWLASLSQWFPADVLLPLVGLVGTGAFYLSLRSALQDENPLDEQATR